MAMIKCHECGKEISKSAKACPQCGAKKPTSLLVKIVFCIFFIPILISLIMNDPGTGGSAPAVNNKDIAMQALTLDFEWGKGGFDNIMLADFTIKNDSDFPVKDIDIECVHSAKSGTVIDKNQHVIYDIVPAHNKKKFKKVSMGFINSQAASSSCRIRNISL